MTRRTTEPPKLGGRGDGQAMPEHHIGDRLDVVGRQVVAARGHGEAAGRAQQRQAGPRRRAEEQARMVAGGLHQIEHVGPHLGGDEDVVHRPGQVGQHGAPTDHREVLGPRPGAAGGQQPILGLAARIADAGPQQEPVALAEGQAGRCPTES